VLTLVNVGGRGLVDDSEPRVRRVSGYRNRGIPVQKPHRPFIAACLALACVATAGAAHADPRADARQAACAYGHILATYDYTHLQNYFAQEIDGATGEWKSQLVGNSVDLAALLTANRVRSIATSVSCTLVALTGDHAQVAMTIGSLVSSNASQGRPQPDQATPTFILTNVGGRWLVSDIATN
jgi:hypothetical protein